MKESLKKYKNNELSASDTEGVEKKMLDAIGDREQRQKWTALLAAEGIERETAAQPTGVRRVNMLRYAIGLAASILLVAVVWQFLGAPAKTASQLADNYISTDRFESPSVRMGTVEDEKNWADAKNAYRDAHFETAAKSIEAIPNPTTEQQFYLALSYLYQKQANFEKAAAGFNAILKKGDGNFKDESRWFYALTLIKMDKKAEAKPILEEILRGGGWKSKEAKTVLDKL